MGDPTQGSTAWYEEAAGKLKAFTEEVQERREGLTSGDSEAEIVAAEGAQELPEHIRKQEQHAIERDASLG